MAFYDFPAKHWRSTGTTNPIESAFGTMIFKECAQDREKFQRVITELSGYAAHDIQAGNARGK